MFKKAAIAATVAALTGLGQAAWSASPATAVMGVSASVANNCVISSSPTFAFGAYDPVSANLSAALNASTTLAIKCTKSSTGVSVGFTDGTNYANPNRRLSDGAGTPSFLNYELYQPSAVGAAAGCTLTRWGSTIGTDTFAVGASNFSTGATAVTLKICGTIPGAQDSAAGTFNDSVTLQVNF